MFATPPLRAGLYLLATNNNTTKLYYGVTLSVAKISNTANKNVQFCSTKKLSENILLHLIFLLRKGLLQNTIMLCDCWSPTSITGPTLLMLMLLQIENIIEKAQRTTRQPIV